MKIRVSKKSTKGLWRISKKPLNWEFYNEHNIWNFSSFSSIQIRNNSFLDVYKTIWIDVLPLEHGSIFVSQNSHNHIDILRDAHKNVSNVILKEQVSTFPKWVRNCYVDDLRKWAFWLDVFSRLCKLRDFSNLFFDGVGYHLNSDSRRCPWLDNIHHNFLE